MANDRMSWELRQTLLGLPNNFIAQRILSEWEERRGDMTDLIEKLSSNTDDSYVSPNIQENEEPNIEEPEDNRIIEEPHPEMNTNKSEPTLPPNESLGDSNDYRILSMSVSYFRGVGAYIKNRSKKGIEYPYGLSLTDNPNTPYYMRKTPVSLVLLGDNGCGKTSLFSAIELLCTGSITVEKKHNIDNKEIFRKNLLHDDKEYEISILFTNGIKEKFNKSGLDPDNIGSRYDLTHFFCSESHFSVFECAGKDPATYVDNELGLSQIRDLYNDLKSNEELIEANLDEDGKTKFIALTDALREKEEEIRLSFLPRVQKILSELMEEFLEERVSLSSDGSNGSFNGQILINSQSKKAKINPRIFFNNFRLKLYMVAVRVAIAFCFMSEYKITFPLVFDDIFDSSDFKHRKEAGDFFKYIRKIYIKLKISEMPLQVILFTQDDVLAESIYEGLYEPLEFMDEYYKKCKKELFGKEKDLYHKNDILPIVALGRLYNQDEANGKDKKVITLNQKTDFTFYNLYDTIRSNKVYSQVLY